MVLYFQKKEVTINASFDINIKDEMDDETIHSTVSFEIEANHEGLNDREDVMEGSHRFELVALRHLRRGIHGHLHGVDDWVGSVVVALHNISCMFIQ